MELLAAILTFVAVAALVLAILSRRAGGRAVEARLLQMQEKKGDTSVANVLKTDTGTFPFLRRLQGSGWSERVTRELAQAGLTLKVSEYLLIRLFMTVIGVVIGILVTGGDGAWGMLITLALGFAGFMGPAWYLTFRRTRRRDMIDKQLPETLTLMANSLRSGFAFSQAMELAAKQIERPMRDELSEYLNDTQLGMPSDQALEQMVERTGSYDMEMAISSILIQRTTGGNLSEILDNVADTVRERERLQGEIRALTSSQRFTGMVLSIYPVLLGLLFAALVPDIYRVLWEDELGRMLLFIALVLQVIGIVSIRRILKLEV